MKSSSCVCFKNSVVQRERLPRVRPSTSQTVAKNVAVSARMPSYSATLRVQAPLSGGDDMCYFACKFFSDSPPSEPTESDSGAGLKTEVCFYD